jgi:hypothetical protein
MAAGGLPETNVYRVAFVQWCSKDRRLPVRNKRLGMDSTCSHIEKIKKKM